MTPKGPCPRFCTCRTEPWTRRVREHLGTGSSPGAFSCLTDQLAAGGAPESHERGSCVRQKDRKAPGCSSRGSPRNRAPEAIRAPMTGSGWNALRQRQAKSAHRLFSSSVQPAQKVGHSWWSSKQSLCRGPKSAQPPNPCSRRHQPSRHRQWPASKHPDQPPG